MYTHRIKVTSLVWLSLHACGVKHYTRHLVKQFDEKLKLYSEDTHDRCQSSNNGMANFQLHVHASCWLLPPTENDDPLPHANTPTSNEGTRMITLFFCHAMSAVMHTNQTAALDLSVKTNMHIP